MFVNEKTPLKGSNYTPYTSISDRQGTLSRRLKQYQCFICGSVLLTLMLAVVVAVLAYSDGSDLIDELDPDQSNLLQLKKAIQPSGPAHKSGPSRFEPGMSPRERIILGSAAAKPMVCADSKFRSAEGTCNNLVNPVWGSSGQPLLRLLPADHCDGFTTPRCSSYKIELPSAYFITSKIKDTLEIAKKQNKNDLTSVTNLLWGEFVYHDLVDIPEYGPPVDLNLATSFLDGSNIYGYGKTSERDSRTFFGGQLLETNKEFKNNAVFNRDAKCQNGSLDSHIYEKIMIRHHNSIALQLNKINPSWDDERLYQEARRIVIAQIQHVTYTEFLPYVMGGSHMEEYNLNLKKYGFDNKYDQYIDPSVSNVFATAVLKSLFAVTPRTGKDIKDEECDFYSIAHNIQRGRTHGLPSYNRWRERCGLPVPSTFEELHPLFEGNTTEILKEIYNNTDDIDLFVGIIAEIPSEGSIIGEVGLCLLADQFKRIKIGDRYWYETDESPQLFSQEQLMEIRKTSILKLICDNLEANEEFFKNITLNCPVGLGTDLKFWFENEKMLTFSKKSLQSSTIDSTNKTNVVKRAVSFTVNVANITVMAANGSSMFEEYNHKPPVLIPLDRIVDPDSYTTTTNIDFTGAVVGNMLAGNIDLPLRGVDDNVGKTETINVRFEAQVSFKWGTTLELDENQKYTCKVLFQSYAKLSDDHIGEQNVLGLPNVAESAKSTDQCTLLLVGLFYERPFYCSIFPWWCSEGKLFYWSGETKVVFKSILNVNNDSVVKSSGLKSYTIKQKTENVIVDKLFASVTVVSGQISGTVGNDGEVIDVFSGSPPLDINLDHIVSPNAYDTSFEITFSGTPVDDSSLIGKFSMPYYTTVGTAAKKTFNGNYTFELIYKYGGSIGIIEPSKTYVCKFMFPTIKKLSKTVHSMNSEESAMESIHPSKTIKGKTPFGESCSIMLSGYLQKPSIFCSITPWWCPNENIFHWTGDAELTLKYKYNDTDSNAIKQLSKSITSNNQNSLKINSTQTDSDDKYSWSHRIGGRVRGGWIQIKNSGFFQPSKTIWSGELPTAIELPIFWTPGKSEDEVELSDVYGHEVVWSCSIFHSSIQGTFLFPQYVGHGPPPLVNWIKGKFFIEFEPEESVSLYNIIVPGMSYRSRVNFHTAHSPMPISFSTTQKGGPAEDDVYNGIRAPIILLGQYATDQKSFIWNGSFIIAFTKSANDFMYY